jgi:hypothetical protein
MIAPAPYSRMRWPFGPALVAIERLIPTRSVLEVRAAVMDGRLAAGRLNVAV